MSRDAADRLALLERRRKVTARYIRGETQWSIARAFEVDQATISRDLAAIRNEWLASSLRDFDEARAFELARIDEVERAAWDGWRKSQENAETSRAEIAGGKSKTGKTIRPQ